MIQKNVKKGDFQNLEGQEFILEQKQKHFWPLQLKLNVFYYFLKEE